MASISRGTVVCNRNPIAKRELFLLIGRPGIFFKKSKKKELDYCINLLMDLKLLTNCNLLMGGGDKGDAMPTFEVVNFNEAFKADNYRMPLSTGSKSY